MSACGYCGERAVHKDHIITKAMARRSPEAAFLRKDARFIVPACFSCNMRRGTLALTPIGFPHREDLERVTFVKFTEWDGGRLPQ